MYIFFFSFAVLISTVVVSHQQQQSNVKPCDSSNIQKIFITYISHTHIAWLSEINENKSLNWEETEGESCSEGEVPTKKYDEKFPLLHTFLHQVAATLTEYVWKELKTKL